MTESQALLSEYVRNGNETAFQELVSRYIDFVYSTALRQVGGDSPLAQDVTQLVFLHLARKASTLGRGVMLGGWLHQTTRKVAATARRTEHRRQLRERQAFQMNTLQNDSTAGLSQIAPLLDDAIAQLAPEDRTAVLLRFFEKRDFRSVGEALGSSEDAARMRVNRAVEKLHLLLKGQGVTISAAGLAAALSAEAVSAAPAGLALSVAGSALVGAAGGQTLLPLLKIIAMTKLKSAIVGALALAGVATPLVLSHQNQARLQQENKSLRENLARLSQLAMENGRLSNELQQAQSAQVTARDQERELLRLRSEVGGLREQKREWDQLKARPAVNENAAAAANPNLPDRIPRAAWAFAGYGSPEAALESLAWAMSNGDVKTFLASVTPEARKLLDREFRGKTDRDLAAWLTNGIAELAELPLDHKNVSADGAVTFTVVALERDEGNRKLRDETVMSFENINGEWKYSVRDEASSP